MNDNAADGTTKEPENKQKERGRKRKYTEKSSYSGFCVICEIELQHLISHKQKKHKETDTDIKEVNTAIPEASENALVRRDVGVARTIFVSCRPCACLSP
ncbi:Hypothetical predicted protein [Cloeon dipterum]|uniref:Uncharacterized protein n=1 Tax=Cloeon dipterum TaxID=197152 RepID=A0A8S1DZ75_9INSE|nr:Hypothetical predicted protein [Cloeon dipterum]